MSENYKVSAKLSDKQYNRDKILKRKRVDIAKYAKSYQSIVPVGAVTRIQYFPPRGQQNRQEEKKEQSFHMIFQMKLNEAPMDENQSFQAYC